MGIAAPPLPKFTKPATTEPAPDLRRFFEPRLGRDLSEVGLRTGQGKAQGAPLSIQRLCACTGSCPKCSSTDGDRIQTKLTVGEPDDAFEREADRLAVQVLQMSPASVEGGPLAGSQRASISPWSAAKPSTVSRLPSGSVPSPAPVTQKTSLQGAAALTKLPPTHAPGFSEKTDEENEEKVPVQAAALAIAAADPEPPPAEGGSGGSGALPPPSAPADRGELTAGGSPLSPGLRTFFESRLQRDLSAVKVHTGPVADAWNDSLQAHAFTYGSHVWLGRGHAPAADFIMAHELAHVIQQSQPRGFEHTEPTRDAAAGRIEALALGRAEPSIRRLSEPFWIPLGGKGKLGGRDLHNELLTVAKNNSSGLEIEAPAPNANRKDWGLGLQGSIDLYKGETMPGLYFDGRPKGDQHPDPDLTEPRKHYRAAMKGASASRFKPFVENGAIKDIDKGPQKVQLGELKPAVQSMLSEGDGQLTNYAEGFSMAARLTNAWASHWKKASWKLGSDQPTRLAAGDVNFVDGGTDLKFDKANPRDDFNLVLGEVRESSSRGAKYVHQVTFNPAEFKLPPIKGGVYAQKYTGGVEGLWMYFARPKNLDEYLKIARSALKKNEMTLANQVQDQVIDPLHKSPEKVTKLGKKVASSLPLARSPLPPVIQRARKTPELKDDFKHSIWVKNQRNLRKQISGPAATEDIKKQIASMELLHKAYKADAALDMVPGTGKTSLPPRGTDLVNIVTGTGTSKKIDKKELSALSGWLTGWTGKPAEILGIFREKLGGTFVWVANKFIKLRDSIQKKLQEHFHKNAGIQGKSGKAKMILQTLGRALKQVARILLPRTLHLVMDAISAGIKKKLEKEFNLDPEEMLDNAFGQQFRKWGATLDEYKNKANVFVKQTFEDYTKNLAWINDVINLSKTVGPILEGVVAGIQCATPPVWGCLKLLAKKLTDCALAKAMNICKVQKEIADLTMKIKPLAELPSELAKNVMSVLKAASPKGLEEMFDEPVAKPPAFNSDEISCEFIDLPSGCPEWGLIEFEGGGPGKDSKEGKEEEESGEPEKEPKPAEGTEPDAGKAEPRHGEPESESGGAPKTESTPPAVDDATRKMEEFLEKLTKEELEELYKEAKRQELLDKPFDPEKGEELLEKVRKRLKARKEAAKKKAKKEKEKKSKGKGEKKKDKGQSEGGAAAGGECVWSSNSLRVDAHVLERTISGGFNNLRYGNSNNPFDESPLHHFCTAGFPLTIKNDFWMDGACSRPAGYSKPTLSTEITFEGKELFQQTDKAPKTEADTAFALPKWGWFIDVNIPGKGTLEIKVTLEDPDTGVNLSVKAKIPVVIDPCS